MVSEVDLAGFDEDLSFSDSPVRKSDCVSNSSSRSCSKTNTFCRIKVKFGVKFDIFGGLNPSTEPKFSRLS